jgi:hypothetical protein
MHKAALSSLRKFRQNGAIQILKKIMLPSRNLNELTDDTFLLRHRILYVLG